jgi:predicted SAM-dependent methyltransferase
MSPSSLPAGRRLHIGGKIAAPGWEVMDANLGNHVDHVGNAIDLSRFSDNTFSVLYASHVLEHFDYADELPRALKEWHRVMVPGGRLYVSVPDIEVLCKLMLEREQLSVQDRFYVMRMMFGGHRDKWDYHACGLNAEFLSYYLSKAGFKNLIRVGSLGVFDDTSEESFRGVRVSLNVTAEA